MRRTIRRRAGVAGPAWTSVSLGLLALCLVPSATATTAAPGASGPWSHFDTGRVNVVYPSAQPTVQLVQDQNASFFSTLSVEAIYEVAPGGLPTPTVLAAAFPSSVSAFNGSAAAGSAGAPVSMFANLAVYPVNRQLWAPQTAIGPTGAPLGGTTLAVAFSPDPSAASSGTSGVTVNWTVVGWPWVSGSDYLAIALSFDYAPDGLLTPCTGGGIPLGAAGPCSGPALAPGQSAWGGGYDALRGDNGHGSAAVVTWSGAIQFGSASSPTEMGALSSNPGTSDLVLMGARADAGSVAGALDFSLVSPVGPLAPVLISGNLPWYAAGLLGLSGAVAVALLGYRRAERKARTEL